MNYFNRSNSSIDVRSGGIYFQDSATPPMEGLVELHDNIMYYLVVILLAVGLILFSIVPNYVIQSHLLSISIS